MIALYKGGPLDVQTRAIDVPWPRNVLPGGRGNHLYKRQPQHPVDGRYVYVYEGETKRSADA